MEVIKHKAETYYVYTFSTQFSDVSLWVWLIRIFCIAYKNVTYSISSSFFFVVLEIDSNFVYCKNDFCLLFQSPINASDIVLRTRWKPKPNLKNTFIHQVDTNLIHGMLILLCDISHSNVIKLWVLFHCPLVIHKEWM